MKHDKELLRRRFARNLNTYNTLATVQHSIAERLGVLLSRIDPIDVGRGIEIGSGTGFLTRYLVELFPSAAWTLNDLVAQSVEYLPSVTEAGMGIEFTAYDGEFLDLGVERYNLIASSSTLQWFDDLPDFIRRASKGLASGGILAISTFGTENFREITATTSHGLTYYPINELKSLFTTAGLALQTAEEWVEQQHYATPLEVLHHLRLTGVNAITEERWTHKRLRQFEQEYNDKYTQLNPSNEKQKSVTLTFHPIVIIATKL